MDDKEAATLARRRRLYTRLLDLREELNGEERAAAQAGLQKCRVRLAESVNIATARHIASRELRDILEALYMDSPIVGYRAHVALSTLGTWAKRLRHEVRVQKRTVKRLQDTRDILNIIVCTADGERDAELRETPLQTSRDACGKKAGSVFASCSWEVGFATRSRYLRRLTTMAALGLLAAVEDSHFLARTLKNSTDHDVIQGLISRSQKKNSFCDLCTIPRTSNSLRLKQIADSARAEHEAVERLCKQVAQFLISCDEELLLTSAVVAELTDHVHKSRLSQLSLEVLSFKLNGNIGRLSRSL